MIFSVRVVPKASRALIKKDGDSLKVYLTRPAQDGLANSQLIELLSEHFKLKKYQVRIIKGENSRNKLVELNI
jgi:uncharacterized protein (TIGR00251 family)